MINIIQQTPANKNVWLKNLLAEIWHFNTQKYRTCLAKQNQAGSLTYVVTGKLR